MKPWPYRFCVLLEKQRLAPLTTMLVNSFLDPLLVLPLAWHTFLDFKHIVLPIYMYKLRTYSSTKVTEYIGKRVQLIRQLRQGHSICMIFCIHAKSSIFVVYITLI